MTAEACFHCGEPVSEPCARVTLEGASRALCCAGCAAAAQFIRDAGLGDYYHVRQSRAPQARASQEDYSAWMHPAVASDHIEPVPGGAQITVVTDQMRCAACAWLIDHAMRATAGVIDVSANAITGRIRLAWDPGRVPLPTLLERLDALGFAPRLATGLAREGLLRRARRRDLVRLGVAGLGALQAMMLSEALYLDFKGEMSTPTRDFFRWVTFLVSTPVVFYAGWPFLTGLWREVLARRPGMDTLIGGSTLLAFAGSVVETVRGGPHVWFDAAVMFVFFLLLARHIETWARRASSQQVDVLARARPPLAWRETAQGRERVATSGLQPGDVVLVPAGDVLPADGKVLAPTWLDESLLTGESQPVSKAVSDLAFAGSVCIAQPCRLQVTEPTSNSRLAWLVRLMDAAQGTRPRAAVVAERLASRFVLVTLAVATGTYVTWSAADPARAFEVTLAVLVIACPCALALAVPAALASAISALMRAGVLVTGATALETLARVNTVILDKTGTLTEGRPHVSVAWVNNEIPADEALRLAATLQLGSTHPLAHAFAGIPALFGAEHLRTWPGEGIEGVIGGRRLRLGTGPFAAGQLDDVGIWLGDGASAIAKFSVHDPLRVDAEEALARLRQAGMAVEILSGDSEGVVEATARSLQIAAYRARQTPESKLARLRELQGSGGVVAMVGDGINDAAVLAGADVALTMGGAAPLAHRASDIVILHPSLSSIPATIALALRTRAVMRQNLTWAAGYNLVALPLAVTGQVAPWLAALGMALSSLGVTLNALRLRRSMT